MPPLSINITHKKSKDEILKRFKRFVDVDGKFWLNQVDNFTVDWTNYDANFSFSYSSIKFKGVLKIENSNITVSTKLPLIFLPLKSKIENIVKQKLNEILN